MTALETVAMAMFDAYNAEGPNPGKTWDGKDVPPWDALNDQVRGKWKAAAALALRHTPAAIAADAIVERNRVTWEESVSRVVTPLLERIDAAERRAVEVDARAEELSATVRAERAEQEKLRLDEARRRFLASIVTELVAGAMGSNTFNWDDEDAELAEYHRVAVKVLKKAGL